jgi:type III restriction enzyme
MDLLAEDCVVEWIITKAALQEGWDCPFAYILVSLANVQSQTSITQLVGRVLRQPFVQKTPFPLLNESYVYCRHPRTYEVVRQIRAALQKEGYEGDQKSVVDQSSEEASATATKTSVIRTEFRNIYVGPIMGKIFIPRFCLELEDHQFEGLDYYRHLLSVVDVTKFPFHKATEWDFKSDLAKATEQFYKINLNDDGLFIPEEERINYVESDEKTLAWVVANLDLEWYSSKRLKYMADKIFERIKGLGHKFSLVRFSLLERIKGLILEATDQQTESVFKLLYDKEQIKFYLDCRDCRFEIPQEIKNKLLPRLRRPDDTELQRSLFDFISESDVNGYEQEIAYHFDEDEEVFWWHRNAVGEFGIQGYRRNRIYPDFVVQLGRNGNAEPTYFIVESKGTHLQGSADTNYKRDIAQYFSETGRQVEWQKLPGGRSMHNFHFRFLNEDEYPGKAWREEWKRMKEHGYGYEPITISTYIVK